jgi:CHAT domain-containing protein/tetratricopeptide (TPR) repeat protein
MSLVLVCGSLPGSASAFRTSSHSAPRTPHSALESTWNQQDATRTRADQLQSEADALWKQGTPDSKRQAIEKLKESIPLRQALNDKRGQAQALSAIGSMTHNLFQPQKAIEYYTQALTIWRSIGDRKWEANTLSAIGWSYQLLGEHKRALEPYAQALAIRREIKDVPGIAQTLNTTGLCYSELGDQKRALEYYNEALPLAHDVGGISEAYTLNNIAYAYEEMGEPDRALDYLNRAIPIWHALGNRDGEAEAFNTVGMIYSSSEPDKAFESFRQALSLRQGLGNKFGEGQTLNNIGAAYANWAEREQALEYYEKALEVFRGIGNHVEEVRTLNNAGLEAVLLDQPERALAYLDRALAVEKSLDSRFLKPGILNARGIALLDLNHPAEALAGFKEALELSRLTANPDTEADATHEIGAAYMATGDYASALGYLDQALKMYRSLAQLRGEADTLGLISRTEQARGNLAEARDRAKESMAMAEAYGARPKREDLRGSQLGQIRWFYEQYISVLMALDKRDPGTGYRQEAFQASERKRAKLLLGGLTESQAHIREGVDPALLERERVVGMRLHAKADNLTKLLAGKHTQEQSDAANRDLADVIDEQIRVQAEIRTRSPRYAALTQPRATTVAEIQKQILDRDTILLEYSLGKDASYLWAITPDQVRSFELPGRAQIEKAAGRVFELCAGGSRELKTQAELAAAELSQMILGPAAEILGDKRLVFVSEGALQYVPLAALPLPKSSGARLGKGAPSDKQGGTPDLLISRHEIVSLPSASVLSVLRQQVADRKPAPRAVAVLADPVLDQSDPRVAGLSGKSPAQAPAAKPVASDIDFNKAELTRSAAESGVLSFERLKYTRAEADSIVALLPRDQSLEALDFEANRARATSAEIGLYRIVHFATHGLLNSDHPELSGVVLSLVDDQGRPQDGFLRLYEIYNMKLGADLVVLSACQTALGKDIRGEGLVGLTRGFMYAGAPTVVATLWSVKDEATAELMKRFYRGMLKDGLKPAAALRAAQLSMLHEPRWSAPQFWAGFVIQGEWR